MTSILLIEDHLNSVESLAIPLSREGYIVTTENSVESAIARLKLGTYDLVLTEAMLSGTSGIDGITLFKYVCPNIAIIVMTAYASIELAVSAIKKGADEFLTKPVEIKMLSVTMNRVLHQHQSKSVFEERNDDKLFSALANPIRRAVLKQLKLSERVKFMDLCRQVGIDDHTKFNFHLRQLIRGGLVKKLNQKEYALTPLGKALCASSLLGG